MHDMEARWKTRDAQRDAREAQRDTDLENRMEQKFRTMLGVHTGNTGATSPNDDRHLTEVFLSKLQPEYKGSMIARIRLWLEGAGIAYKDVKVLREFATFAFVCFNTQTERESALILMQSSIDQKHGNDWDEWEVRENRPKRPNNRPEQTPVEKLMYQARNKVRDSQYGKQANLRINMNWSESSLYVTDMKTCKNIVLGQLCTTRRWEWTSHAANALNTDMAMKLEERPIRQQRGRIYIPIEE